MPFKLKAVLWIAGVIAVLLAVLLGTGVLQPFRAKVQSASLLVWDIAPHEQFFSGFFRNYTDRSPNIKVSYVLKNPDTYLNDLIDAFASGTGPDIFYLDGNLLTKQKNKIAPLASAVQLTKDFKAKAADVLTSDLIGSQGELYGIPWSVDTLALYYNKDYLNALNIPEPPKTWAEFQDMSLKLTRRSPTGQIQRSGAAFGLGRNVANGADILSMLALQAGNPIYTPADNRFHFTDTVVQDSGVATPVLSALKFYTSFASPDSPYYTWNSGQPEAQTAFANGKAAFYLGYARELTQVFAQVIHSLCFF